MWSLRPSVPTCLRVSTHGGRRVKNPPSFKRNIGNPRESRLITDACTLMEPTPDSGVSCALMVARRFMTESRSHGVLGGDD
ncbi:Methylenetetrahydrofolate--tRNA- (uracil-5-)-methyltransferase TrmFO [Gossypium arboreum]|uniref:Methylenetetrahydrofolate--tRNA-(Uracil-5-)-methyltransferase TrmFO n=1 Tax=Gossypium arboreum TaxID=29729 RepID=A0A0B0MFP5_GOSAR|nr:Methylenetetrahydrofolate--tRNA- (uracil-5-)-methyltransferase TrmFO [Gossypium arboreum]